MEDIFGEAMALQFFVMAWVICMTVYKIVDVSKYLSTCSNNRYAFYEKFIINKITVIVSAKSSFCGVCINGYVFGLYAGPAVHLLLFWDTVKI